MECNHKNLKTCKLMVIPRKGTTALLECEYCKMVVGNQSWKFTKKDGLDWPEKVFSPPLRDDQKVRYE